MTYFEQRTNHEYNTIINQIFFYELLAHQLLIQIILIS